MLMRTVVFIAISIEICLLTSCSYVKSITVNSIEAIRIATDTAVANKFSTKQTKIEIIKVTKGVERGPIRFVWLINNFPKEDIQILLKREFWIVFFYPKGLLDGNLMLGGGFCVLVDLYSGEVLYSFDDV